MDWPKAEQPSGYAQIVVKDDGHGQVEVTIGPELTEGELAEVLRGGGSVTRISTRVLSQKTLKMKFPRGN